jgi:hypothetical protein
MANQPKQPRPIKQPAFQEVIPAKGAALSKAAPKVTYRRKKVLDKTVR